MSPKKQPNGLWLMTYYNDAGAPHFRSMLMVVVAVVVVMAMVTIWMTIISISIIMTIILT